MMFELRSRSRLDHLAAEISDETGERFHEAPGGSLIEGWQQGARNPQVGVPFPAIGSSGARVDSERDELLAVRQDLDRRRLSRVAAFVAGAGDWLPGDLDLAEALALQPERHEPLRRLAVADRRGANVLVDQFLDSTGERRVHRVDVDRRQVSGEQPEAEAGA